ncbi:PREDICTED: alkane hydroxylase MAH1-like [Tarenaya hassleriana]|uniref:alkane hydroxylase MAH1-like n=1 Tax=Tarenaya hassleriana TaxID=28532 RepID=UPI00053C6A74|nr:PREDICTED: alkane hydroxylase MAH1-like [Tarenaya hassleriana]
MASPSIGFLEISIAFVCFLVFHILLNKKPHACFPRNWPFLGMLPGVLVVFHRVYDWAADVLEISDLTFTFKGPWFAGIDMLVTVDPSNIHHIMSSHFSNYPKGPEFKEVFDVLGDGILNVDSDLWENLRKSTQSIFNHEGFKKFSFLANVKKLKTGLLPFLDQAAKENMVVDVQDVLERYIFDTTCITIAGYDPGCLSIELPEVEFYNALNDAVECIVYRHVKPRFLWKIQNWLGVGAEGKMRRAHATFDRICAKYASTKREEIRSGIHSNGEVMDLLAFYMNSDESKYKLFDPYDNKFQRDTLLTFMVAGMGVGSTLTRLFWLLSKNPESLAKIRQEIQSKLPRMANRDDDGEISFDPKDLKKLVYLHGAICETLRLYPPVPFERKSPTKEDVLPSGHKVGANEKILIIIYAMGRMKAVWGEDASDFKPERWISESGGLKHEPSYKFLSFNAGPRACLGREMAFTQLKTVFVEIIRNYDINVVEGQEVKSVVSVILRIQNGLRVTVSKRSPSV